MKFFKTDFVNLRIPSGISSGGSDQGDLDLGEAASDAPGKTPRASGHGGTGRRGKGTYTYMYTIIAAQVLCAVMQAWWFALMSETKTVQRHCGGAMSPPPIT